MITNQPMIARYCLTSFYIYKGNGPLYIFGYFLPILLFFLDLLTLVFLTIQPKPIFFRSLLTLGLGELLDEL